MRGFLASILGQFGVRCEQKQTCVAIMAGAGLSQQSAINFGMLALPLPLFHLCAFLFGAEEQRSTKMDRIHKVNT
jgi:hypothetical protein